MTVAWFCPELGCDAYGQDNVQATTGSFGIKPDGPCEQCGTDLEWRTA